MILYLSDALAKFDINKKKDDVVGVITTYISRDIWFHTNVIDCPHEVRKKINPLFDKVDKS